MPTILRSPRSRRLAVVATVVVASLALFAATAGSSAESVSLTSGTPGHAGHGPVAEAPTTTVTAAGPEAPGVQRLKQWVRWRWHRRGTGSGPVTTVPVTTVPTTTPPSTATPPTVSTPTVSVPTTATSPRPPSTAPATTVATAPPTNRTTNPPPTAPTTTRPAGSSTMPPHSMHPPSVTGPQRPPVVLRLTNGSGGATAFDSSSAPGPVEHHGTRIYCVVSHFSHDDPIVYPGQPGAAHAHMFWGNTLTDHASTGTSIRTTGHSSCEGGTTNRSAYWTPVVFNRAGEAVLPETVFVYYKTFGGPGFDRSTIRPIPAGLEMLASAAVANAGDWNFRRNGSADTVDLMVSFPTCLQVDASGKPVLTSADNVSHVSYPSGSGPSNCPASHPYRIPQVIYALSYDLPFDSGWSLSSDQPGMAPGASLHADYIAAWDDAAMAQVVDCNILARRSCEFSGGRDQLPERFIGPDGRAIYRYSVQLVDGADRTPFGTTLTRHAH